MALAIEIVALGVAAYGAGLSTYNVARARRQEQPDVLISSRLFLIATPGQPPYAKQAVRITIANMGARSVEVDDILVRDETGKKMFTGHYPESSDELPKHLSTAESARVDMPIELFLRTAAAQADVMKLFAVVYDTAENEFSARLASQIEEKVFELAHRDRSDEAVTPDTGS